MAEVDDFALLSADDGTGTPWELVLTSSGTKLAIWISGVGNLVTSNIDLDPNVANMVGLRMWEDAGVYYWKYYVNGVADTATPVWGGSGLNPDLVSIAAAIPTGSPTLPGYYDEVLWWESGNSIGDGEVTEIYISYLAKHQVDAWSTSDEGFLIAEGPATEIEVLYAYVVGFTDSVVPQGGIFATKSGVSNWDIPVFDSDGNVCGKTEFYSEERGPGISSCDIGCET